MVDRAMQERNLDALANNEGFEFTDTFVPYTSGQIGPYYVYSERIMRNRSDYRMACRDMKSIVVDALGTNFEVISGGEKRDWIFSLPVAWQVGAEPVMICKSGEVIGANMTAMKVVHIADLNNEGSSPRDMWVPTIKKEGGHISDIFFYVDRMEDGVQVMKDLGLNSYAVVPLDEHAWDCLQKYHFIELEFYKMLMGRMEDRDTWAKNMLRSDAGFKVLEDLFLDPSKVPEARKILDKGYPDIAEELKDRLIKSRKFQGEEIFG